MKTRLSLEPGTFYAMDQGHIIVDRALPPGEFELGQKIELNSMLDLWVLQRDSKQVGFYCMSAFKTLARGGFLLTFMESKRGKAKSHRLALRQPDLIIYDFPGCGALAVSTKVNEKFLSILMEQ